MVSGSEYEAKILLNKTVLLKDSQEAVNKIKNFKSFRNWYNIQRPFENEIPYIFLFTDSQLVNEGDALVTTLWGLNQEMSYFHSFPMHCTIDSSWEGIKKYLFTIHRALKTVQRGCSTLVYFSKPMHLLVLLTRTWMIPRLCIMKVPTTAGEQGGCTPGASYPASSQTLQRVFSPSNCLAIS